MTVYCFWGMVLIGALIAWLIIAICLGRSWKALAVKRLDDFNLQVDELAFANWHLSRANGRVRAAEEALIKAFRERDAESERAAANSVRAQQFPVELGKLKDYAEQVLRQYGEARDVIRTIRDALDLSNE